MIETRQILADYVKGGSEKAFGELVARHINPVFSTALRMVRGDALLAEDVAQLVFIDLARQAARLPNDVHLGGWLHRHTCFTAAKALRGELRRINRERRAMEMKASNDEPDALLKEIGPMLDGAINDLGAADRLAIILRFFEQHDFHAVGLGLGVSEDAARMRVNRAVDKLRAALAQGGVACPAVALGNALTLHAVLPAPAGMAAALSANALAAAAGAGAGGGLGVLLARWLPAAKMKVAVVSGLGALLVVVAVKIASNSTGGDASPSPPTATQAPAAGRSNPTAFERIQAQLSESARQPAASPVQHATAIAFGTVGVQAAVLSLYSELAGRTILHGQLGLPAELLAKMTADPSKAIAVFEKELEAAGYAVVPDGEKFIQIMPLPDTNKPRAKPPPCNPGFSVKPQGATNVADFPGIDLDTFLNIYGSHLKRTLLRPTQLSAPPVQLTTASPLTQEELAYAMGVVLHLNGIELVADGDKFAQAAPIAEAGSLRTNAPKPGSDGRLMNLTEINTRLRAGPEQVVLYYCQLTQKSLAGEVPSAHLERCIIPQTPLSTGEFAYAVEKALVLNGFIIVNAGERIIRIEVRPGSRGRGFGGGSNSPQAPKSTPNSSTPAR